MHNRAVSENGKACHFAKGEGLVFAGGCPRSGLTLLRRLLSLHPGILAGSDTGVATAIAFQWRNFATSLGSLHQHFFDLERADVASIMGRHLVGSLRAPGADSVIVEKTSLNVIAFEAIADMLPNAKFIHVVRDGRDVAASLLDRDWRNPATGERLPHVSNTENAIAYWMALIAAGLQAEQTLGAGNRIIRVRYEDLVREPENTFSALTAFTSLPQAEPQSRRTPLSARDYLGMERDSLPLLLQPITPSRIGRYKTDFPAAVTRAMEQRAAATLAALGY